MRIFAIDVGLTGGWAAVEKDRVTGCGDMPVAGEGAGKRVSGVILADLMVACHATLVVVEQSWPRPENGSRSAFSMGTSYGTVLGVAAALGIPVETVAPQTWKRSFRLIGTDKEASRGKALELCPHLADSLRRRKDHGRAEAVLIGLYGARTWGQDAVRVDAPPDVGGDAGARWNAPTPDGGLAGDT